LMYLGVAVYACTPEASHFTKPFVSLADHGKMVQTQSKLVGQHNENDMVLKELNLLEDEANVYKLVGPVLLKQDLDEAKSNVEKRLQYIGDEM
jgi:prefoldin beta subunit